MTAFDWTIGICSVLLAIFVTGYVVWLAWGVIGSMLDMVAVEKGFIPKADIEPTWASEEKMYLSPEDFDNFIAELEKDVSPETLAKIKKWADDLDDNGFEPKEKE